MYHIHKHRPLVWETQQQFPVSQCKIKLHFAFNQSIIIKSGHCQFDGNQKHFEGVEGPLPHFNVKFCLESGICGIDGSVQYLNEWKDGKRKKKISLPISTWTSKRPGLRSASSMRSLLLVMPEI